jgi:hypothetical protein
VLFFIVAIVRGGLNTLLGLVIRLGAIVLVVAGGYYLYERNVERDRAEERRALEHRGLELTVRAISPGSVLGCLEATSGDSLDGACERAVFAGPETVAAATAFIGARLALLNDANDFANRRDPSFANSPTFTGWQRMVSADRFGLVAHVLAARDGCTFENCDSFALVPDPNRLRANLRERTFDALIARYATNWPSRARVALPGPGSPATPGLSFPPAASVPPVSAVANDPPAPAASPTPLPQAAPTPPPPPAATAPVAQKRPPPPKAAPKAGPPPPVQIGPPPSASAPPPRVQ